MPTKADLEAELEWTEKGLAEWRDIAIGAMETVVHNYELLNAFKPTDAVGKQLLMNLRSKALNYKFTIEDLELDNENT
jgi:hypothetical protein